MDYCQYHPLKSATYCCESCHRMVCDTCSDEQNYSDAKCFYCRSEMHSLGDAQQAEPFWRRLEQSFKYPITSNALPIIIGVAVLSTLLSFVPFAAIWQLLLAASMVSYCFACLEGTAKGQMLAPDITKAYEGGLILLLKLFGIFGIASVFVGLAFALVGMKLGIILAFISISCIPAGIILLSVSDDFLHAINPRNQLNLVSAIGWPYGLLLCFILMMSASVSSIHSLVFFDANILTMILTSVISNFYMVVMFHIMGYMIYQYQDVLGFSARADHGDVLKQKERSDGEKLLQQAEMAMKDGDAHQALEHLIRGVKQFPETEKFKEFALELLLGTKNTDYLDEFGSFYLEHLIDTNQDFQLTAIYKRIRQQHASFKSDKAPVRFMLASRLLAAGDFTQTIIVLNGLHKDFPEFEQLSEAFQMMSQALSHIPGKEAQAEQAMKLSRKYAQNEIV